MITLILVVVGLLVGGGMAGWAGAVLGAGLGFVLGDRFGLFQRLARVESAIDELKQRLHKERSPPLLARTTSPSRSADDGLRTDAATRDATADDEMAGADEPLAGEETGTEPSVSSTAHGPEPGSWPSPDSDWREPPEFTRPSSAPPVRPPSQIPLVRWMRGYFTTGNVVVKVGALILFIGVAFLVKYAAEHTRVPIEFRLMGVCVGAVALLAFGWRLRERQRGYSLILQGVGIAVFYLVVFAALRLYSLVPAGAAFGLLAAIGLFSAVLAITQNALVLAMMGAAGGFLAPILTSTGQGSHVVLFTYFALLDAGIVAIAWFKSWRPLNLLGFVFTFGIGAAWGVLRYVPSQIATTEPFLVLFFVFFVAIAVIFAFRQAPRFTHYVDGTLVFGTPVIAFALQSALVRHIPYALAYSALIVGAFYVSLAWFLHTRQRDNLRLLVEAFLALGVAFGTLAVPLALDGRWTAATWALEGAAILWVGIRQNRMLARLSGVLLQFGSGIAYALGNTRAPELLPIANSHFLGSVLVSVAGFLSAWLYERAPGKFRREELALGPLLFIWALAWWLFAGVAEIHHSVAPQYFVNAVLVFFALTALGSGYAAHRLDWVLPRVPALCLLPAMVIAAMASARDADHFLEYGGFVAWPLAFVVFYRVLWRHEERLFPTPRALLHALGFWLLAFLVSAEASWGLDRVLPEGRVWSVIPWAVVPASFLLVLPALTAKDTRADARWPFGRHANAYMGIAATGLAAYLVAWSLFVNLFSSGDPSPLPYVPLLNPLDIAQCFAFLAMVSVLARQRALDVPSYDAGQWRLVFAVMALTTFAWLNAVVLRTLHHWAHVPFDLDDMARSTLVQSTFSIFWTLLALATMLWATRRAQRLAWIAGAALMGVVVVKLMFVDLSSVGTVARIVSFVAVGLLMLLLGNYLRMPSTSAEAKP